MLVKGAPGSIMVGQVFMVSLVPTDMNIASVVIKNISDKISPWRCHDMESFSLLLLLFLGIHKSLMTESFGVFLAYSWKTMKLPVISEGHNAHYDDTVIAFSIVIYRHFFRKPFATTPMIVMLAIMTFLVIRNHIIKLPFTNSDFEKESC